MKMSRRALRMDRKHKRSKGAAGINLVSMMDIFTILVFFLLVNTSDGEILQSHKSVILPESVSEEKPRQTVVIMINPENVMIYGKVVTSVNSLLREAGNTSPQLQAALVQELDSARARQPGKEPVRMEATIMGDKTIPYQLLKKVMATVTLAGYQRVSLAVTQTPAEGI
jgi:biopolymer transport protein ExbD